MKRIIHSSWRSKQLLVLTLVLTAAAVTFLWTSTGAAPANNATISGQVFNDKSGNAVKDSIDTGLQGWTVFIDTNSDGALNAGEFFAITDANGNYSLTLPPVPAGSVTLKMREVVQGGWMQTTSNPADIVVTSTGGTFSGRDFGDFQKISISGAVYNDVKGNGTIGPEDSGLPGWAVFLDTNGNGALDPGEPAMVTGVPGNYSFTNLGPGTYKVREVVQNGWMQTSSNLVDIVAGSGDNADGASFPGLNFANFQKISVSGQVFNDAIGNGTKDPGDSGLPGLTVFLDTNGNGSLDNGEPFTVTDPQGSYILTNIGPFPIVREIPLGGWQQTTPLPTIVASSGTNQTGIDFGNFAPFAISGTVYIDQNGNGVRDAGEPGQGGWMVVRMNTSNVIIASRITAADGSYSFKGLSPGTSRIREVVQASFAQTTTNPADIVATSGSIQSGVDFGTFKQVNITGQVFKDLNASGSIDAGETGLSGWTVFLDLNNNGIIDAGETSVTTDATGNYSFSNVGPGPITVREVVPGGWDATTSGGSFTVTPVSGTDVTINFGDLPQFVVVNTHDSGLGSLRQAITDANATAGASVINITFSIAAAGVQTIAPTSALPAITHPVVIDGYSQPGTSPNTLANGDNAVLLIELSGAQAANADGLIVTAAGSTVKGLIVNRFTRSAIGLFGNASTVSGNWIGVDSTGTAVAANSTGIAVSSSNNQIGGTTPAARNVISGNIGTGIGLNGGSNLVQGNFIGTDITGTVALGNKNSGISNSGSNNTVGGTTPGASNLISGNGIGVLVTNASGNLFQGNLVGTKCDGTGALGNLDDGFVVNGASNNTIGGTGAGAGNTIAFNGRAGVFLVSNASVPAGDSILANSIFSNSGLGIDLSPNGNHGVTPNDPGDADTGPNNLQNFPVVSFANQNSSGLNVAGSLNSTPSTSFRIEFFVNSACDSSGSGEGQTFIGATNVTTDANGLAAINGNLTPGFDALGKFVTSTATRLDAQGNTTDTSEFSACVRVPSADLSLTGSASPNPVRSGDNLTYTLKIANNGPDAVTNLGFSDQLPSATTFVSCSSSTGAACSSTGGNVTAALGNLANSGQVTITITAKVSNTATGSLSDTATIATQVFDPSPTNNSVTILTDVTPVAVIQFSQSNYTVAERGGSIQINVARTGDTSAAVSVDYATDDGSTPSVAVPCAAVSGRALERCDYTRSAGTLSFAAGETQKSFIVLVNDDSYTEGAESLQLVLANPVAANLGAQSNATLQITDDAAESSGNPVDDPTFFIRQHYHDFLNREPDQAGLDFWTGSLNSCGSDPGCRDVLRINDSAAFFLSIEFQQTGYLVERLYKVGYGDATGNSTFGSPHTLPVPVVRLREFLRDTQQIGQGVVVGSTGWDQLLETNKQAFVTAFVSRQRFTNAFPLALNAQQFVTQLDQNAGQVLTDTDKAQLMGIFGGPSAATSDPAKRALVLRQVAETSVLQQREFNRAFVLMQFFGYLRRNPDDAQDTDYTGFDFWLTKLNQFNGDFIQAEMVKAFITSAEYRQRFGQQ
jgi:uncharacterized repeat protein (TIGR01451 family)